MRRLVSCLVLLLPQLALSLTLKEPYRSGVDLCSGPDSMVAVSDEDGFFVDVPVDYSDLSRGTTKIYTWTTRPFDGNKPSVVYFSGGPGGDSHGETEIERLVPEWNVIHFNQRGVSCSRPENKALLLDPGFFSSENTARDAEEIRKKWQLDSWSLYGHSYGTVPATIAAHRFPESTRAVVLEGVVFDGEDDLMVAPHKLKIIQRYFDRLSADLKAKVLEHSNRSDLPRHWFSVLAKKAMYENYPLEKLTKTLESLFAMPGPLLAQALKNATRADLMFHDLEFGWGGWTFAQISCKELSGTSSGSTFLAVFEGEKLVPLIGGFASPVCKEIGVTGNPALTYRSTSYAVRAPITYLQGGMDGATEATSAIFHFKKVPRGPKQLLIAPLGGHTPSSEDFQDLRPFRTMFEQALLGKQIAKETVLESNQRNKLRLSFTSSGF